VKVQEENFSLSFVWQQASLSTLDTWWAWAWALMVGGDCQHRMLGYEWLLMKYLCNKQ